MEDGIPPQAFARDITCLAGHGYQVLSPDEALALTLTEGTQPTSDNLFSPFFE